MSLCGPDSYSSPLLNYLPIFPFTHLPIFPSAPFCHLPISPIFLFPICPIFPFDPFSHLPYFPISPSFPPVLFPHFPTWPSSYLSIPICPSFPVFLICISWLFNTNFVYIRVTHRVDDIRRRERSQASCSGSGTHANVSKNGKTWMLHTILVSVLRIFYLRGIGQGTTWWELFGIKKMLARTR